MSDDRISSLEPRRMCAEPTHPRQDKEIDCLHGFVRTVHSEIVALVKRGDTYVNDHTSQIRDVAYDRQGNALERIVYGFDSAYQKHVDSRVVYTYDAQQRAMGWEDYANGRPVPAKSVYSYDGRGNRIRETVTQADGKIRAVLTLVYDAKGQNIERITESPRSVPYWRIVNFYDEKRNLTQSTAFDANGELVSKSVNTFDAQGNRIEAEGYTVNSNQAAVLINKTSYQYDTRGVNTRRRSYGSDGTLLSEVIYRFNDHGDLSSVTSYGKDGTFSGSSLFDYQYDSLGNWIRCTHLLQKAETSQPEAYYAEIRTLAYY